MKPVFISLLFLWCTTLSACAPSRVFPPEALAGIESDFDFAQWRVTAEQAKPAKVQLGGRIVQSGETGDRVIIVVAQMPIVDHPAYGPKDNGKQNGEFAIIHRGTIRPVFLQPGNRVMVVGTTHTSTVVSVDDIPRSFPSVVAQCLHFWNTQGREIGSFPNYNGGYATLQEQTICTKN